ncbi:uncharacterized protein BDZ83DRAFT_757422 [Colletotrichum acutatum]|uniref:Uncharacterized protein n=1 Tax=Glomerella acutata TaxID=27357 RepID=A0AAD8UBW8_GLOAC|nr:uncharacterized protein BDZ83DRAFT_757422 [Colletotrichum acutatum]KAK1710890.1 hypothetical protein BDZ83DRAFT_757422 [Colletotrichum acutatum]
MALRLTLPLRPLPPAPTFVDERDTPKSPVGSEDEDEEKQKPGAATGAQNLVDNRKSVINISSLNKVLPIQNYTAHSNLKGLPGLDFGVDFHLPILAYRYSGLMAKIIFPFQEKRFEPSQGGQISAAARIKEVMDVGVRTFEGNSEICTLHEVCEQTFGNLRMVEQSWRFSFSLPKITQIVRKIIEARERHLDKNNGVTETAYSFFPFLKAIDNFREKVYAVLQYRQQDAEVKKNVKQHRGLKRSRDDDSDAEENAVSVKKARQNKEEEELAAMSPEEQVKILKTKNKELETKLLEYEYNYRHERDARAQADKKDLKTQGEEEEWEEGHLQGFLRWHHQDDAANALLGIERREAGSQ